MAKDHKESFTQLEQTDNPALQKKRDAMHENTQEYAVKDNDTLASIAREQGIGDYHDLLALNRLMGNNLAVSGKNETNVLIKKEDKIFIPKNREQFQSDIEGVKKISEAIAKNRLVAEGNREVLKKEINEQIFPKFRQSLGMNRLNDGLLGNMRASLHFSGPRQVDPKFEKDASCAHYYRQELRSAFNIGDMPNEWKKFMNTGNIDAWELPIRLLNLKNDGKNEFVRKENFMDFFDTSKFGAKTSPIAAGKEGEYAQKMVTLNEYLEQNPNAVNTAIPVYYRYSRYQWQGLAQARAGGEKHYNTHMMRYIWSTPSTFPAYDWWEVHPDGTITSFGGDKKRIEAEISNLNGMLGREKSTYEDRKKTLLEYTKNEFPKHHFTIDEKLAKYSKGAKTEAEREVLKQEMESLFDSGDMERIRTRLSKIIAYPVTEEDAKYLISLQKNKHKLTAGIKYIEEALTNQKPEEYPSFDPAEYGVILAGSKQVSHVLASYNDAVQRVNHIEKQIVSAKEQTEAMENDEKNQEKIRQEARERIVKITPELEKAKEEHERVKKTLLESLDEGKNPELRAWFAKFDSVARKYFGPNGGSQADMLIQGFRDGKLGDDFRVRLHMSEDNFNYLKNRFLRQEKIRKNIVSIQTRLGVGSDAVPEVHIDNVGAVFGANNPIVQALGAYNASAAKVNEYMDDIHAHEEKLKIKKEIPVTEYLLNFLQQRADYSDSAIRAEGRKQIAEGLAMYAGAVKMKVNGKIIDIAEELKKPKKDQSPVSPEDTIELSGPVMSDGFHGMTLKDPIEKEKMQGRQRFFFELLATQTFFPSETIEPTPGSLMHRTDFREATDGVKNKGSYSLNRGDTIEHAIKRIIPIQERVEFEKLDPNSPNYEQEYQGLIQKYYALQIKGLQMLGYMQSEDTLNPGAIKINGAIPYFDSNDISGIYAQYINTIKAKKLADNKETAPYKEYLDVQLLPGDTYANLFARIVKNLESYGSHFDKYSNIQCIGRLSEPLKREFLEQYIDSAIKSDEGATWEKLFAGKVKPGTKFILHLTQIDKIAEWLQGVSYTGNVDNQLRNLDKDVVNFTVPVEQSRDIVKTSMMIESYDRPNSSWFRPTGIRKFGKKMLEEYPSLRTFHALNSVGDFQIRIHDLKNGWNEEWPNRKQVEYAIARLKNPSIEKRIESLSRVSSSNKSIIEQDKSIVRRIELILSKAELEPRDFEALTNDLIRLARIDDETGSNIIGKSIGASLDADSFGLNFQKVWWMLERSGEDMEALRNDKEKSRVYGQAVLLAHNLSEKKVLLGFTENYVMRLLEKINSAHGNNTALQYPELQTSALSGSIHYGLNTFMTHIQSILGNQELSSRWGTPEEQVIFTTLRTFNTQITEAMQKPEKEREKGVIHAVYALLADKDLRSALERYSYDPEDPKKHISASLLPNPEEFSGNGFRNVFFNYIRKGEEIEKRAMEKKEIMAKNGREENIAAK